MKEQKEKKKFSLMYILGGGILTANYVMKHTGMIVLIVIMLFFYISNRYSCIIKLREIDRLQMQLKELQSEAVSTSVRLTGNTRPSQVEELVKRLGLDIEKSKTPPYILHK
jgi:cell division protein FtsL